MPRCAPRRAAAPAARAASGASHAVARQADGAAGAVVSPRRSGGSGGRRRGAPAADASGDDELDDELDGLEGAIDPSPFMDAVIKGAPRRAVETHGAQWTRVGRANPDAPRAVFASHAEPNYSLPWQRKRQMASTSSGFIIEGARLRRLRAAERGPCASERGRAGGDTDGWH